MHRRAAHALQTSFNLFHNRGKLNRNAAEHVMLLADILCKTNISFPPHSDTLIDYGFAQTDVGLNHSNYVFMNTHPMLFAGTSFIWTCKSG